MSRHDVVRAVRALGYNLTLAELVSYEQWDVAQIPCVAELAAALNISECWLLTGQVEPLARRVVSTPELDRLLLERWEHLDEGAKKILIRMANALAKGSTPHG
jgi:hypothetical protein